MGHEIKLHHALNPCFENERILSNESALSLLLHAFTSAIIGLLRISACCWRHVHVLDVVVLVEKVSLLGGDGIEAAASVKVLTKSAIIVQGRLQKIYEP